MAEIDLKNNSIKSIGYDIECLTPSWLLPLVAAKPQGGFFNDKP
jgi:hypothetical protein